MKRTYKKASLTDEEVTSIIEDMVKKQSRCACGNLKTKHEETDRQILLKKCLQGTKDERSYEIISLIGLLVLEYNQMHRDKPLEVK
jgi:hypothetical protein